MKLEWTDKDTVFIPDVGTVRQGAIFEIADERGQDLVTRGAARLIVESPPVPPQQASERGMQNKRPAKEIVVTLRDGIGVGDQG